MHMYAFIVMRLAYHASVPTNFPSQPRPLLSPTRFRHYDGVLSVDRRVRFLCTILGDHIPSGERVHAHRVTRPKPRGRDEHGLRGGSAAAGAPALRVEYSFS